MKTFKCKIASDDCVNISQHDNGLVQIDSEGFPLLTPKSVRSIIALLQSMLPASQEIKDDTVKALPSETLDSTPAL